MSASTIDLAVIPGDGIGPEVTAEAVKVLERLAAVEGIVLQQTHYKLGAQRWLRTGETLPEETLDDLRTRDAILLGAIGATRRPSVPSGVLERGFLLKLRFAFDHHVNLRPSKLLPGVATPLAGQPGASTSSWSARAPRARTPATAARIRKGTPHEVATEVSRQHRLRRRARGP